MVVTVQIAPTHKKNSISIRFNDFLGSASAPEGEVAKIVDRLRNGLEAIADLKSSALPTTGYPAKPQGYVSNPEAGFQRDCNLTPQELALSRARLKLNYNNQDELGLVQLKHLAEIIKSKLDEIIDYNMVDTNLNYLVGHPNSTVYNKNYLQDLKDTAEDIGNLIKKFDKKYTKL